LSGATRGGTSETRLGGGKLDMTEFFNSVDIHLTKADFTAIDMRKMTSEQIGAIGNHVGSMTDANRAKFITIK
jgi:hypothetical protein